jgi:hypothetical protein
MNTLLNNVNLLIAIIAVLTAAGLLTAYIAYKKGYSFLVWFGYGSTLIIIALIHVFILKPHATTIEPIAFTPTPRVTVAVEDKTGLMEKYAIFYENNQYVWGSKSFNTLDEAISTADAFIDTISVDVRLPIEAF